MALDGLSSDGMGAILAKQKAANIRDGIPSAAQREAWIDKSIDLLVTHDFLRFLRHDPPWPSFTE